ncbi:MAG: hypothetical protein ACI4XH_00445 [Acutalibacteraceae bacterium]
MTHYTALLISYIIILTFGYFATFLLYYLFGWYYDKRLRLVMKRIRLTPAQCVFLHFRGVPHDGINVHSAVCTYCEIFSLISLFGFETISLLLVKFVNFDMVIACRISFLFMIAAFIGWAVMAVIISAEFRRRINEVRKSGKVSFKNYRELDNIVLGMENFSAWAPELAETIEVPDDAPNWYHYVVDFAALESLQVGKKNVKVKTPTGGFYRPVDQSADVKTFDSGKETVSSKQPLSAKDFIPVNIRGGEEVEDLGPGKEALSSKGVLDDDIFVPQIPIDAQKFGFGEVTGTLDSALDIKSGKEELKAMTDMSYGKAEKALGRVNPDSVAGYDVSTSVNLGEGSVTEGYSDELKPENKLGTGMPGDDEIVEKLKKQSDLLS